MKQAAVDIGRSLRNRGDAPGVAGTKSRNRFYCPVAGGIESQDNFFFERIYIIAIAGGYLNLILRCFLNSRKRKADDAIIEDAALFWEDLCSDQKRANKRKKQACKKVTHIFFDEIKYRQSW